jgi:hypothetical protein
VYERVDPADPAGPRAFRARTQPLHDGRRFAALADSIRARFQARAGPLGPTERAAILARIEALAAAMGRADVIAADEFELLSREDRPDEGGSYVLFADSPDSVVVSLATPAAARRAVCWTAHEARDLATGYNLPRRQELLGILEARVRRWESFHDVGYSMFLTELLVNSWIGFPREPLEPPRQQWILLHPSAGVEVPLPIRKSVDGTDALLLEGVGVVRYNEARTTYLGLSAAAVFVERTRPAYGVVAHVGRYGHVGYLLRRRDRDALVLSVDLYKTVSTLPSSWRGAFDEARAAALRCLVGVTPACRAEP